MVWNRRGTIYGLPAPVKSSSSGKGEQNVILRPDQKEYVRAKKANDYFQKNVMSICSTSIMV
jgi:hypothetical protein